MGLSQGLLLGNRQTSKRQPPSYLAVRLCFEPLLHRLTDMPGGMVPDEERPFALSRKACGKPGEKAQVTALTGRLWIKRKSMRCAVGT